MPQIIIDDCPGCKQLGELANAAIARVKSLQADLAKCIDDAKKAGVERQNEIDSRYPCAKSNPSSECGSWETTRQTILHGCESAANATATAAAVAACATFYGALIAAAAVAAGIAIDIYNDCRITADCGFPSYQQDDPNGGNPNPRPRGGAGARGLD